MTTCCGSFSTKKRSLKMAKRKEEFLIRKFMKKWKHWDVAVVELIHKRIFQSRESERKRQRKRHKQKYFNNNEMIIVTNHEWYSMNACYFHMNNWSKFQFWFRPFFSPVFCLSFSLLFRSFFQCGCFNFVVVFFLWNNFTKFKMYQTYQKYISNEYCAV